MLFIFGQGAFSRWTGGNLTVDFSPVTITSEQFGSRVFFRKDSVDKFIEDNAGDVSAANVALDSVDSITYTAKSTSVDIESPKGTPYCTTIS